MSVARNCDGFIVDNGKLEAVLQRAMEEHEESDEDYETVSAATSMALGAFLALGQAVSALDNEGFCAGAASEREAKVGSSDNIIWASE
jgi:hypothetical protein